MNRRTYDELSKLDSFEDRFNYLSVDGRVGEQTFGSKRLMNQLLYRSQKWKRVRDEVIIRDNGCDLGVSGREINAKILVHHMNPITIEQVMNEDPRIYDPNELICVSHITHEAIHYGSKDILMKDHVDRTPGDTKLW